MANELKMGKWMSCGGYDYFWVQRNLRHFIYEEYKKPVTDELLDTLIDIIKQGE